MWQILAVLAILGLVDCTQPKQVRVRLHLKNASNLPIAVRAKLGKDNPVFILKPGDDLRAELDVNRDEIDDLSVIVEPCSWK